MASTRFYQLIHQGEAWRIVEPVLRVDTPVFDYEPGTWGPTEANHLIAMFRPAVGTLRC